MNNVMRHQHYPISETNKNLMTHVKDAGLNLYTIIDKIGASRELSLAKTKIEEAVMWATKHLARWKPLPKIEIPSGVPILGEPPNVITLGGIRRHTKMIEQSAHIADSLMLVHTDMEPDVRDLEGFTATHFYDPTYEEEFGRVERIAFAAHPDLPRFSIEGTDVYPVIYVRGDARAVTYHIAREL